MRFYSFSLRKKRKYAAYLELCDMSKSTNTVVYLEDGHLYLRLRKMSAHNLCNLNNTAPSISIIRITIYAANGSQSHSPAHVLMRLYRMDNSLVC